MFDSDPFITARCMVVSEIYNHGILAPDSQMDNNFLRKDLVVTGRV